MFAFVLATSFMFRPFEIHVPSADEIIHKQQEDRKREGKETRKDIDGPEKDKDGRMLVRDYSGHDRDNYRDSFQYNREPGEHLDKG